MFNSSILRGLCKQNVPRLLNHSIHRISVFQKFRDQNIQRYSTTIEPVKQVESLDPKAIVRKVPKAGKTNQSTKKLRRTPPASRKSQETLATDGNEKLCPVTTFTTCEEYDLKKVTELLHHHYYYSYLIPDEVVHVIFPLKSAQSGEFDNYDIMILSTGTVVAWGVDEQTVKSRVLPFIDEARITPYKEESEEMDYVEIRAENNDIDGDVKSSYMDGDIIIIQGNNKDKKLLEQAAFASGLSRSTRLAILETSLENHIVKTKQNSINLSIGKKLSITEEEVLKFTGRLFLLRGKLNLYSELIETPDLYWSEPNLEKIYNSISRNLDIAPRISILNRKLDYATEESRALLSVLNEKKGTRLEWIIIVLIMVEVCFETFHFYERYVIERKEKS